MLIVDAHLDLAYNALRGRDVLLPAHRQPPDEQGIPTVGLPDLRIAPIALICATIYCQPADDHGIGYRTPAQANSAGWAQMRWYQERFGQGDLLPVTRRSDLPSEPNAAASDSAPPPPRAIILMEGADPILSPEDVDAWFQAGVRMIGLAWRQTRYAGGTGVPGPLTPDGIRLIPALDEVRMIHDVSHLAEASFWQLLEISRGPICATHSNCRAIVPTDRQLSDEMIRAIVQRRGVIGINFFDQFLIPPDESGRRATLADVIHHIRHICDLAGNARHVGIGTDMDGGLGREQIPQEISTSADLPRLADALSSAGFGNDDVAAIMGANWLAFFARNLPGDR